MSFLELYRQAERPRPSLILLPDEDSDEDSSHLFSEPRHQTKKTVQSFAQSILSSNSNITTPTMLPLTTVKALPLLHPFNPESDQRLDTTAAYSTLSIQEIKTKTERKKQIPALIRLELFKHGLALFVLVLLVLTGIGLFFTHKYIKKFGKLGQIMDLEKEDKKIEQDLMNFFINHFIRGKELSIDQKIFQAPEDIKSYKPTDILEHVKIQARNALELLLSSSFKRIKWENESIQEEFPTPPLDKLVTCPPSGDLAKKAPQRTLERELTVLQVRRNPLREKMQKLNDYFIALLEKGATFIINRQPFKSSEKEQPKQLWGIILHHLDTAEVSLDNNNFLSGREFFILSTIAEIIKNKGNTNPALLQIFIDIEQAHFTIIPGNGDSPIFKTFS